MKKQIRSGLFETNSSSVHAICINLGFSLSKLPTELHFEPGEFGWEYGYHDDTQTKASYLYTSILSCNLCKEYFPKIEKILNKYGIKAIFDPVEIETTLSIYEYGLRVFSNSDVVDKTKSCSVDHGHENLGFITEVCNDENKLMSYLFGDAVVETSNDNGGPELETRNEHYDITF
jgi:hypothetical protein